LKVRRSHKRVRLSRKSRRVVSRNCRNVARRACAEEGSRCVRRVKKTCRRFLKKCVRSARCNFKKFARRVCGGRRSCVRSVRRSCRRVVRRVKVIRRRTFVERPHKRSWSVERNWDNTDVQTDVQTTHHVKSWEAPVETTETTESVKSWDAPVKSWDTTTETTHEKTVENY